MRRNPLTKLMIVIFSFLIAAWGLISGCDSKKDNVQPLYGVDSVKVNQTSNNK